MEQRWKRVRPLAYTSGGYDVPPRTLICPERYVVYTSAMTNPKRRRTDIYDRLPMSDETRAALKASGPPLWTIEDRRKILSDLIVHEDKLTGERVQALYTFQGFLFASFGFLARTPAPFPLSTRIIISIIAGVGIMSARLSWQELHFNAVAITQILADWDDLGQLYPAITYTRLIG